MSRRRESSVRKVLPDPKFNSIDIAKFMNIIMFSGKKSLAEKIVYGAFDEIYKKCGKDPVEIFNIALSNIKPIVEVKSRRVGGSNFQIPVEVPSSRRLTLAMRWLCIAAKKRKEKSMILRISEELQEAANNEGFAVKKRDDIHRMAESNKAFSHFRF